jgi:hypothetical protein
MILNASSLSRTKYDALIDVTRINAYHIGAPHWFHKGEAYPCIFIKCVCVSNQRLLVTIHEEFFIIEEHVAAP